MIHEEDAVQVIDFMLEGDRQEPFGPVGDLLSLQVERLDHHGGVAADVGGIFNDRQAPLLLVALSLRMDDAGGVVVAMVAMEDLVEDLVGAYRATS